jgi:hypothetical protein
MNADFESHLNDIATYLHSVPESAQQVAADVLYKMLRDEYASSNTAGIWNMFRSIDSVTT